MASMAAHFTAALFLYPLGIRRLLCSSSLYLNNPSLYRSRIWYFSEAKWKNLDLYALLIALPIASLSQIFIFLAFSGNPTFRFSFLQQSFVIFIFWALLLLIFFREILDLYSVPENFVFLYAAIAFVVEFYMTGRGINGLGGVMYGNLGGLSILCAGCFIYLLVKPGAFFAEFLLSCGLVLKGSWVLQVGLSLFTDVFSMKGCAKISGGALANWGIDVNCELEDDRLRGVALVKLLFVGHVIVAMVLSLVVFSFLHRCRDMRYGEAGGSLLAEMRSESMLMHPLPEFEIE